MSSTRTQQPGSKDASLGPKPAKSNDATLSKNHLVELLIRASVFREYQRAFEDATGLPLILRTVVGWQLAHNDNRRQNCFFALMSRSGHSCAACLQMAN